MARSGLVSPSGEHERYLEMRDNMLSLQLFIFSSLNFNYQTRY